MICSRLWRNTQRKRASVFCATFGTTETSARMAYLPPEMARLKTGSIGKAIPEGELFLLDVMEMR